MTTAEKFTGLVAEARCARLRHEKDGSYASGVRMNLSEMELGRFIRTLPDSVINDFAARIERAKS